jgi:hypothetical protein
MKYAYALVFGLAAAAPAAAGSGQDAVIADYAAKAKVADAAFAGFDAAAGKTLFFSSHAGGGPDTPSCTSCHTDNINKSGLTRAGKAIEPMAASKQPDRYADLAKVQKWMGRNCNSVLGRDCTAKEAGDVISWLASQ